MKKKELKFTVTLSVPHWMTKTDARREIRSRINEQTAYSDYWGDDNYSDTDVRAKKVF